jgi:hypothetical protein
MLNHKLCICWVNPPSLMLIRLQVNSHSHLMEPVSKFVQIKTYLDQVITSLMGKSIKKTDFNIIQVTD